MNLNERISKILEYSQLSSSEFADAIEVQRSSISHITSGRNKPSLDFLVKVKSYFPDLDWDWLINGEGEMFQKKDKKQEMNEEENKIKPTPLPDLFSLIDDDNFGITETEDRISSDLPKQQTASDLIKTTPSSEKKFLGDSQRLENNMGSAIISQSENEKDKVKRIVLFYESGRFESFEP